MTFSRKTLRTPLVSSWISPEIRLTPSRGVEIGGTSNDDDTMSGGLGDTLDVIPRHLPAPLGTSFSKSSFPPPLTNVLDTFFTVRIQRTQNGLRLRLLLRSLYILASGRQTKGCSNTGAPSALQRLKKYRLLSVSGK